VARIESGAGGPAGRHGEAEQTERPEVERPDPSKPSNPSKPADPSDRDADPYAVARAIVLRQLTMAPRSRHQLREKLRHRDCPDEVAEAVLDRMSEVGLVDDEKYADALVRSKQVSRGLSKRGLAHELRTKGVDRDIADSILDQVDETEEEARARDLVDARLRRLRGLDRDVVTRRLAGMLARKGYPAGLSLRVIREAIDIDPAFRRD
jgi:regulatory protein